MPGKRFKIMDIRKMLLVMSDDESDRAVSRQMGIHRHTVQRYREWATRQKLFDNPFPSLGDLKELQDKTMAEQNPPQNTSSVEPY